MLSLGSLCSSKSRNAGLALALMPLWVAVPAGAQHLSNGPADGINMTATVDIEVLVQEITVLSVQKGNGTMIVDSMPADAGNFMLPTSTQADATNLNEPGADIPIIRLETNVDISALHLDFPRRNGFNRGCSESNPGATFFGEAVLSGGSAGNPDEVLGVWPQMARVLNGAGDLGQRVQHNCGDSILNFTDGAPYVNGVHEFAIGVSTSLDHTLQASSNLLAPPGLYEIQMSLTVVP